MAADAPPPRMHRPTELPEWMADAVTSLCALSDEDPLIRSSITKAVGEFRKSHQDMWEQVRTHTRIPETLHSLIVQYVCPRRNPPHTKRKGQ